MINSWNKIRGRRVSGLPDTRFYNFLDKSLIAIVAGSILIFILFPVVMVIRESIYIDGGFTLAMYQNLFTENSQLLVNSVFVAGLATLGATVLALCIALYVSFSNDRIKNLVILILMLTMISPPFVSSLAYITLFGRRGFITHDLLGFTLNTYGWHGIALMQGFSHVSLSALIIIGVIQGIDKNLIHASLDLGADMARTLKKIVIPLAKPGIIVAALLTFINCLSDFGTPIFIGGGFNVLATEAYLNVIAYYNLSRAAAMSTLIMLPAFLVFLVYRYYMNEIGSFSGSSLKSASPGDSCMLLKGSVKLVLSFATWIFLIFMLLQYGSILMSAITRHQGGELVFTGQFISGLSQHKINSLVRSIVYALIAGIVGSGLGILFAYFIERRKIRMGKTLDFIATLPYIIPGTFFGIGYILAFNNPPLVLTGTAMIVVLNYIFRQIPMTSKTGSAVLKTISPEVEEAGRDLGVARIWIIKDIILPLLKPAFLVGFISTFTVTMTSIGAVIFLIYPGGKVATVELFNCIRDGKFGEGSVIACLIILVTLIVNVIFSKVVLGKKTS